MRLLPEFLMRRKFLMYRSTLSYEERFFFFSVRRVRRSSLIRDHCSSPWSFSLSLPQMQPSVKRFTLYELVEHCCIQTAYRHQTATQMHESCPCMLLEPPVSILAQHL